MTPATQTADPRPPIPLRVSYAVATGSILQPLNSSMIAVAIVAVAAHFGSAAGISWVISSLYIATAVSAPMAGRLGSIFGARRVYLGGLAAIGAGSVTGAMAPNVYWLVAGYVLIGTGTATQFPNAMTMVRAYADRHRQDSRTAITTLAMCGTGFAALGPTVGGLLVGAFGWQSILWINLPVIAVSAFAVTRFSPKAFLVSATTTTSTRGVVRSIDLPGIALFLAFIVTTMLVLLSLADSPRWWLVPLCVASLGLFILRERRAADPFIDVRALARNRALSATLIRSLLTYTAFYCIYFGIPQWLQYSRGMSPIEAGLTMLPVAGVGVLTTWVGSRVCRRFGVRRTLITGTVALLAGGVLLAVVERSTSPLIVLLLVAGVLGIPNGFNNIGNQNTISAVTSVADVGTAMGMYRTVAFIGANLSAVAIHAIAGPVIYDDGLHRIGWFIATIAIVLLVGVLASPSLRTVSREMVR